MATGMQRVAINCGGGYVPGLDKAVIGAVLAAAELGCDVVGIRDGYDGLLLPEQYGGEGVIKLDPRAVERLDGSGGSILGAGARTDPFRVRRVNSEDMVEELDRSDELMKIIRAEKIDAVISIVGGSALTGAHAFSVAWKLSRKGLRTVCIPKSVENDIGATALSFGYNSALSYTTDTLERIRSGARDVRRIAVVEVLGYHAGWLALQAGMAACADAVLIPEIPYDLRKVAERLRRNEEAGRSPALIVVAEGAEPAAGTERIGPKDALRKSLAPLSDPRFGEGARVIERSGMAGQAVALDLQRLTNRETVPFSLGQLIRTGMPTAVDCQLGLGYGAAAVRAVVEGHSEVMVAFEPPALKLLPLAEAVNNVRTIPADSEFLRIARTLGISLGD